MEKRCPVAHEPIRCQCAFQPESSMLHVSESTSYYRKMGMIRCNGMLYSAPLAWSGYHFISMLIRSIDSNEVRHFRLPVGAMTFITMEYTFYDIADFPGERHFVVLLKGTRHDLCILSCLRRIQRAMRGFLRKKRQARFVCLAMGLHPRLGGQSPLVCLCSDALQQVFWCYP